MSMFIQSKVGGWYNLAMVQSMRYTPQTKTYDIWLEDTDGGTYNVEIDKDMFERFEQKFIDELPRLTVEHSETDNWDQGVSA